MTPLWSFLKQPKNVQQWLCHRQHQLGHSSTWAAHRAVPGLCLSLGKGSGPNMRGRSPFKGAPGMQSDQPSRSPPSWVGGLGHSSEQGCAVWDYPGF